MGRRRAKERGFTLIETLVATALFGLLMVGVFTVYASNTSVFNRGASKAESHQNARIALDQLAREVRMAGYDLSGVIDSLAQPSAIQVAESTRLTFVADVDRDGTLDQLTYRLSSGQMLRTRSVWNGSAFPTATPSVLAGGVDSISFGYFDDGQPTNASISAPVAAGSLEDVARITLTIVASSKTGREDEQFPLFVDVKIRN